MKALYLIILFNINLGFSATQPWLQFENMKCKREFIAISNENKWYEEDFKNQVPGSYKEVVYVNISKRIGEWVEVHFVDNEAPEIVLLKDQKFSRMTFDSTCEAKSHDEALPWQLEKFYTKKMKDIDNWSDEDLKKVVSSSDKGLIYYWSPKFTYSVFDLPRVEALAKKMGYFFIPVVDPRASSEEIKGSLDVLLKQNPNKKNRTLASKYNVNRNVSLDLYMRNGFNHFPVTYVFGNKKVHPRWITGVMTDKGHEELIKTFSKELKDSQEGQK